MFLRELTVSLDHIKGAGPATIRTLAKAGIIGVADLLCRYPRDWEDRSVTVLLRDFKRFPAVCTVVRVLAHDWFGFGRMKTLKVHVEDESARAVLVCFNRPFLEKQLIPGNYYRLWGRFYYKYGEIQSTAFEVEPLGKAPRSGPVSGEDSGGEEAAQGLYRQSRAFGHILPVYPLIAGLNQGMLRRLVQRTLVQYAPPLEDELPGAIISREGLLPKGQAIRAIHFPASSAELDRARRTLIYEELFYLEMMVGRRTLERRTWRREDGEVAADGKDGERGGAEAKDRALPDGLASTAGPDLPGSFLSPMQRRLLERLPFDLTPGQIEAITGINRDMDGCYPMARLLQGDVGSGKTLVSFLAVLRAVEKGGQAALMAPTELLARQHAENAAALLEPLGIRPAFLTGNIKAAGRSQLLKSLAAGDIDMVVGTHALFSAGVVYHKLRLVIVDEQHRFGVLQRQAIMAKGHSSRISPGTSDLLMMSSTPIPRTLALTVFGDLDVSVIWDLPPGRKPVRTHLARQSSEARVYDFVQKELAAGRQAYFVYPLIEANKGQDLKDAQTMAERLAREVFSPYPLALVHSRVEEEEKRRIMDGFRRGEIRILVATSVVEVGVDVPNASCMVIEHAERFGLSALHQLRGRVGRGTDQSYCFLVYSDSPALPSPSEDAAPERREGPGFSTGGLTEDGKIRLKVMLENNDGFIIAEEDLKLRGPGQIAGTEQSGYLSLNIADPVRDTEALARARTDAFAILEKDPGLLAAENRCIAEVLKRAPPFSRVRL
ncbi:MAG: ATP-dependent DNA helicase RecG [Spirochaetaceae bacterium]|jgi:ATP-dependent DNA helicase RecG|nr:ATP-dependent DNA helicase RecG [Spirochaetaceae bacterium]